MSRARKFQLLGLIATVCFAMLAAGCDAEGEGRLQIKNPKFFPLIPDAGAYLTHITVGKCHLYASSAYDPAEDMKKSEDESFDAFYARKAELRKWYDQQQAESDARCKNAFGITFRFIDRAMSLHVMSFDVHCRNVQGGARVLCSGGDGGLNPDFGPVRFVSLTEDKKLLGLQVWQMEPAPKLIANFGDTEVAARDRLHETDGL